MFAFLLHPFKCLFGSTTADETEHVHAGTKAPYGTTVDQVSVERSATPDVHAVKC